MSALLLEIIGLLTTGITEYAVGLGSGIGALAENLFITQVEGGGMALSVFGGLVVIFAAISLVISLSRFILNWVSSFGASN